MGGKAILPYISVVMVLLAFTKARLLPSRSGECLPPFVSHSQYAERCHASGLLSSAEMSFITAQMQELLIENVCFLGPLQ